MVYLSKLGDRSRFYIQESKLRIYFQDDNLRVLYKYKDEEIVDLNAEYLFKYEILPQSVSILENGCKNNMGISVILFLIFQIDELREEVVDPKYRNRKDIELGLKYIKTCNLMKNLQDDTNKDIVDPVSNVLNLFIDICSKKKYLKTMINTIFILQKMNKLQDKCFKIVIDEENVLLDLSFTKDYPFTFFVIFEDCSYFLLELKTPGIYQIGTKGRKMYILCNKVKGYEVV
uniref:Pre-mRNA splicing helicase n=1 Tax=Nosema pernyi TaxID=1112939 RepID=A0A0N7ABT2_9MICR|nr:pre-mRNA splicing helicase [Nosema pernyi]